MTREATLCLNNLNALRIFARISKFRCFHETKQTQNDVGKFFYNLAEFVFEFFCDSRIILATFTKFCLNSLFATWSYRYPNPKRAIQRARAPLPLPHRFFDETKTLLTPPLFAVFLGLTRLLTRERERALDDVFGIWVMVRSCCEKWIKTKLCKSH